MLQQKRICGLKHLKPGKWPTISHHPRQNPVFAETNMAVKHKAIGSADALRRRVVVRRGKTALLCGAGAGAHLIGKQNVR